MVEMFFKKENMTEKSFSPIVAQYYKMIAMAAWQHGSYASRAAMPADSAGIAAVHSAEGSNA